MNDFEFLNYLPTPNEKYFMGIATIRFLGRLILKYKIVLKKDGSGFFVAAPNFRLPVGDGDDFKYIDAIMIDSRSEHDDVLQMIRQNVNNAMSPNNQKNQQQENEYPPEGTFQGNKQQQQAQQGNYQPDLETCPF